jgi:hypothetical protein
MGYLRGVGGQYEHRGGRIGYYQLPIPIAGGIAMNRTTLKAGLFLMGTLILSGVANAEWMWTQGNAAVIESPDFCTYKHYGWGLQMEQDSGFGNWVHLPVPTKSGGTWGARYIRLKFYTGSADAMVTEVHVYNGNQKKKEFKGLNLSNGWKDIQLDLGSKMIFSRGLGVTVKIGAGVEMMSHRFIFAAAGANFYE